MSLGLLPSHRGRTIAKSWRFNRARDSVTTRSSRLERLREPEIQQLDVARAVELDVGRLQVPVDDSLLVGGFETLGDLEEQPEGLVHSQRASSYRFGERLAYRQYFTRKAREYWPDRRTRARGQRQVFV
jgi:hypothetical protein